MIISLGIQQEGKCLLWLDPPTKWILSLTLDLHLDCSIYSILLNRAPDVHLSLQTWERRIVMDFNHIS